MTNESQKAIDAATQQFVAQVVEITNQSVTEHFRSLLTSVATGPFLDNRAAAKVLKNGGPKEARRPARSYGVEHADAFRAMPQHPKARRRSKPASYDALVPKLVALIRSAGGKLQPGAASTALKLSSFQRRALVEEATKQGMVRTTGVRRSTLYRLGAKVTKKKAK